MAFTFKPLFLAAAIALAGTAAAPNAHASLGGAPSPSASEPAPSAPSMSARTEPFGAGLGERASPFAARWREMEVKIAAERVILAECRTDVASCPEEARRFLGVVEAGRSRDGRARLGAVNRAVNLAVRYTADAAQHGRNDVWSSPLTTFASGMGDCEDYAIAKYLALVEAGIGEPDLRVVLVRNTRRDGLHAVLAARLGDEWLILDNAGLALAADRDLGFYLAAELFGGPSPTGVVAASMFAELPLRGSLS